MFDEKIFGQRLAELRKQKGVTQKQVAEHISKTLQTYRLYEAGKRDPRTGIVIQLADYFNVSLEYLLLA